MERPAPSPPFGLLPSTQEWTRPAKHLGGTIPSARGRRANNSSRGAALGCLVRDLFNLISPPGPRHHSTNLPRRHSSAHSQSLPATVRPLKKGGRFVLVAMACAFPKDGLDGTQPQTSRATGERERDDRIDRIVLARGPLTSRSFAGFVPPRSKGLTWRTRPALITGS